MDYQATIERRLAELKKSREEFIAEANKQLAGFNAAITELDSLLKLEQMAKPEGEVSDEHHADG